MSMPPELPPDPERKPGARRRRWIIPVSAVVVVVVALTVTLIVVDQSGGEPVAGKAVVAGTTGETWSPEPTKPAGRSGPGSTTPSAASPPDKDHVPGWQTLTMDAVSYDVPPTWTPRSAATQSGKPIQLASYMPPNACPGHPDAARGGVTATAGTDDSASASAHAVIERFIRDGLHTKAKISWGKRKKGPDDLVAIAMAQVPTADNGSNCPAPSTLVLAYAWTDTEGPATGAVLLVFGEQGVPDAESVENLTKIINSVHFVK